MCSEVDVGGAGPFLEVVHLLKADVAVSPGVAFGEYGEGHVRIGLVENEQRIRQAAKNIKKLLI